MRVNKKMIVTIGLGIAFSLSVAANISKPADVQYTNLQVLPKNISSKELQGIMVDDFGDGLGATCGTCHAAAKGGHGLDFASDAKPEKEISRSMMRMTLDINKNYFKLENPTIGSPDLIVTCYTCHKGVVFPEGGNGAVADPK